jgi:hypothetical protein
MVLIITRDFGTCKAGVLKISGLAGLRDFTDDFCQIVSRFCRRVVVILAGLAIFS